MPNTSMSVSMTECRKDRHIVSEFGWISLDRKIINNWVWQEKPFSIGQAWIDMLLMANHSRNRFPLGDEIITIEAGDFVTSELKLMERWGWSKSKVRRFLKLLETDGMIVKKSDRRKTTITVVNYSNYQKSRTDSRPIKDHSQTDSRPIKDTNNNDNNENNVINKKQCASDNARKVSKAAINELFESVWKLYPSKKGKGQVSDAKKKVLYDIGYDELSRAIERYKVGLAKDEWRKPQNGSTFFNSGYVDYLDANYSEPEQNEVEPTYQHYDMDYLDATMEKFIAEGGMIDGPFK